MSLEICRICGSKENLKHVFREGTSELLEQIRLCANIQINDLDCLPKFVCDVCEQGLAFSYRLRKRGEETEKKLHEELLNATKNEPHYFEEESQTSDVGDCLIDELQDDELWIKDEDRIHYEEQNDLIEHVEETYDVNQNKDSFEKTEEWVLPLQNEDLIENEEYIVDADLLEEKTDSMEIIEENLLIADILDQCELQSSTSGKYIAESEHSEHAASEHTVLQQIECETCAEVFETKSKYFEHVKEHGGKRFHCNVCDKWFSRRYVFDQHVKNHSSKTGAFPCQKCDKSYTNHWNLERHTRSAHNGEKKFQCAECGASFGRADVLKMHMAKHTDERNIQCDLCPKKFKTTQHLHFHKKSHLDKSERPKKPVRLKTKPKPKREAYVCEFCEKVSHHRTTHINHLRTHTGEKPFQCNECEKSFRTTHARTKHILTHTDQRPYECNICGTSFRQSAHLKSHMLIHNGVKRHVCDFCEKAFTMKNNLMVHLRTHTGEMPYKCSKCPKKFINLSQVKRHQETCDGSTNELQSDLNDSPISLYVYDIIEMNEEGVDDVVISDCVIDNLEPVM